MLAAGSISAQFSPFFAHWLGLVLADDGYGFITLNKYFRMSRG
jgi:hypothetical protein